MARTKYVPVGVPAEGMEFEGPIVVGTGVTEYIGSDRYAYEVIDVRDQKHVTIRRLDHVHTGDGCMDNNWELWSDDSNPVYDLVKYGDLWYWSVTVTSSDLDAIKDDCDLIHLRINGFDPDKIRTKGKQTKRSKANVWFGRARYYYDYEF